MTYLERLTDLKKSIGNTPLIKLTFEYQNKITTIYAKEEFLNPSGSIKIRPAYKILEDAIKNNELKEGQRIAEVTSGNMGIALSYLCAKIGNPISILMPRNMSEERKIILKELGADIVYTDDFLDAFKKQDEFEKNGAYLTKQFDNVSNLKAYEETAKEIVDKVNDFDCFVSGVGTGGTLMGCGGYLKKKYGKKVVAIDPAESGLLKNKKSQGKHKIQGLSDQIIPSIYDENIVDKLIEINSDDAIVMARMIKKNFNVGVGISSGANILGAILSNYTNCATVFADDDKRYLSTDLFNESIESDLVKNIKFLSIERI